MNLATTQSRSNHQPSRRAFLAAAGVSPFLVNQTAARQNGIHLATNQYSWQVFYGRAGKNFGENLDAGLAEAAACGIDGFEPNIASPADIETLAPLLKKHGLEMRSLYVNSVMHERDRVEESIGQILRIAEAARKHGARFIVTNPSPIRWGGPEDKSDAQLRVQAAALDELGARLRSTDLTLAYHNHDAELRNAAREFHHMMLGTDPENVTLCLDSHWIYRGAGDSNVALMDILDLYGGRVTEWHLRQSKNGVWTEAFGPGDLDYPAIHKKLSEHGAEPHYVLEQAVENGSPHTMEAAPAHKQSVKYARGILR